MSSKPAWATKQASRWPEQHASKHKTTTTTIIVGSTSHWVRPGLHRESRQAMNTQWEACLQDGGVVSESAGVKGDWETVWERQTARHRESQYFPLGIHNSIVVSWKKIALESFCEVCVITVSHVIHCLVDFRVCKILIVLWFQIYHIHTPSHTLTHARRHAGTYWYIPMPAQHKNKKSLRW